MRLLLLLLLLAAAAVVVRLSMVVLLLVLLLFLVRPSSKFRLFGFLLTVPTDVAFEIGSIMIRARSILEGALMP